MSLINDIRQRMATAERKIQKCRAVIAFTSTEMVKAEQELEAWKTALSYAEQEAVDELAAPGGEYVVEITTNNGSYGAKGLALTLSEAQSKESIVRTALKSSEGPVTATELWRKLQPAVGRSTVFWILGEMEERGEVQKIGSKYLLRNEAQEVDFLKQ